MLERASNPAMKRTTLDRYCIRCSGGLAVFPKVVARQMRW